MFCIKYPGVQVLLCRKSLPSLRNSAVKTYQGIVRDTGYEDKVRVLGETRPTEFIYEKARQVWDGVVYEGVSRIVLSQIDLQGKALGAEYDMVYINQPDTEGLTEDEFLTICSRARLSNAPYRQRLADPNPAHEQHWLKKGEITETNSYREDGKGGKWKLIKSNHKDNPAWFDQENQQWTELGLDNIRQLEKLPENRRKNLLEGQWYSTEGMVFSESWDDSKHILRLDSDEAVRLGVSQEIYDGFYLNVVPKGWHHYLSLDWGGTDPFVAILIARHPTLDLFIAHKHIYIIEPDITKIAQMTKEMIEGYEIKDVIADKGRYESTFFQSILDLPITNAKKGAGSNEDSINICTSELNSNRWKFLPYDHSLFHEPDALLTKDKKLMGCEEIPNLKKDPKNGGIARHQQDHYYDSWKYFCRYWSQLNNSYERDILVWLD